MYNLPSVLCFYQLSSQGLIFIFDVYLLHEMGIEFIFQKEKPNSNLMKLFLVFEIRLKGNKKLFSIGRLKLQ